MAAAAKKKARKPGLFVFASDWRSEPTLLLCSEGARLLWWEMLLLMSESEPRGYLLVRDRQPTPQELAVLTRTDHLQVEARLAELEANGVFSRTRTGLIYSRRIVRDEKTAREAVENGKKGGNPTITKQREKPAGVNPPVKAGVNRGDKLKPNLSYSVPNGTAATAARASPSAQKEPDLKKLVYDRGKALMGESSGGQITKAIAKLGLGAVAEIIETMESVNPIEPKAWFERAVKARLQAKKGPTDGYASAAQY